MKMAYIGGNGHHYLSRLVERGDLQVVAAASDTVDEAAARRMHQARCSDVKFYQDYRQMLDAEKIDVVSVGAVYGSNGDVVAEALRRGIRVCSDKPIATTSEQLAVIRAECKKGDRILLTEFNLRSDPWFRAAYQAVNSGTIGKVVLATAQKSYRFGDSRPDFYKKRQTYGGTLMWVASHGIDAVWFVTGKPFEMVGGFQGNVAKPEYGDMEDHVAVCYRMADGAAAMVHADYLRPAAAPTHGDDRLRVVGSNGLIEVRDGQCILMTRDQGPRDVTPTGADADLAEDLWQALQGDARYYGTSQSLYMADVLLWSREAADMGQMLRIACGNRGTIACGCD